jgi:hypothetical protein
MRSLIPALVATLITGSSLAQEPETEAEKPAPRNRGVEVCFFAVALHPDAGEIVALSGDARGPAFTLPLHNLTQPQFVKTREIALIPANAPADKPLPPIAKIKLPDQGNAFRILLVPIAKTITYQPIIVRGDDPDFGEGSVFFVNLGTEEILGNIGSETLKLASGSRKFLTLEGARENAFFDIRFAIRKGEAITPLSDTRWPVLKRTRAYVLFYNDPAGKTTYRAVDEFIPPKQPAAP